MSGSKAFKLFLGGAIALVAGVVSWNALEPERLDFEFEVVSRVGTAECALDLDGDRVEVVVPADAPAKFFRLLMPHAVVWTCQTAAGSLDGYESSCGSRIRAATIEPVEDRPFC